ncbi:hypothetical protein PFICI_00352 [Pestalotiopsis fici W106-1]|uniref:BZIP domain-containing protein n=1 Tax=Pestalotiopsis fici (strain W106-1 / CGMCC3.15140) TaxID=1229662 RepID=W3XKI0_PESFW|nr:uncharacterized protein PFICI_00352 [Pestalotiopsis fici W106-1]ETS86524.1 hypothetical protein PFICI_00352 [Pestalotiopsis fici W106-1]
MSPDSTFSDTCDIPVTVADDWSGVTSSRKRRKIQNRLNQRAYRARNRHLKSSKQDGSRENLAATSLCQELMNFRSGSGGSIRMSDLKRLMDTVCVLQVHSEHNKSALQAFEVFARHCSANAPPHLEFLPILTQFHFTRALFVNVDVMGLSQNQMHDDALSPFNITGPWDTAMAPKLDSLPLALRPTELQVTIPHHPWIDLLPLPQFRDNILIALDNDLDEEALCQAFSGRTRSEPPGIIVWQDPWDPSGWEISEAFARSHGWLLKNCWALFDSTNKWRARRGERPLLPRRPSDVIQEV